MGVLQWFKRDNKAAMSRQNRYRAHNQQTYPHSSSNAANASSSSMSSPSQDGTVRTPKYKQDLAEFQARRASLSDEYQEIKEKKSKRQSLPCTKCAPGSNTKSSPYQRRVQSEQKPKRSSELAPNIQFLFRNQVFMPGAGLVERRSFSERKFSRKRPRRRASDLNQRELELLSCKQLNFDEEEPTPLFFKNNYLNCDVKEFLRSAHSDKAVEPKESSIKKDIAIQLSNEKSIEEQEATVEKLADSCEAKVNEVLAELHSFDEWADEQLKTKSPQSNYSVESERTDCSFQSVRIVQMAEIDFHQSSSDAWRNGKWGCVAVQIQRLTGYTISDLKKEKNTQFNILRKLRHPNIILLMGLFLNKEGVVHLICEKIIASLYEKIHLEGFILSVQKSVKCAIDVSSALLYLKMQGFFHTKLWSGAIMITDNDTYKLAEFDSCTPFDRSDKCDLTVFSPGLRGSLKPMKEYQAIKKYKEYASDPNYMWQAPECFRSEESGEVYLSSKSDVYSLTCILWECCNAMKPFDNLEYDQLKEMYLVRREGLELPRDGTYPGCLLEVLQKGLNLEPEDRMDLKIMAERLNTVKDYLSNTSELIVPEKVIKNKSELPAANWKRKDSFSETHQITPETNSDIEDRNDMFDPDYTNVSFPSEFARLDSIPRLKLTENTGYNSNCSTPKSKRTKRQIGTPCEALHRTDSTEYRTLFSFDEADDSNKLDAKQKLSYSLTPKNYKSLKIKLPSLNNLDDVKSLNKHKGETKSVNYSFDIKNYSLPTTPIARNNTLLRNAWLSGDNKIEEFVDFGGKPEKINIPRGQKDEALSPILTSSPSSEGHNMSTQTQESQFHPSPETKSPKKKFLGNCSIVTTQQTTLPTLQRPSTWTLDRVTSRSEISVDQTRVQDETLAHVDVKPLVAKHERWISEANNSTYTKSQSSYRGPVAAVKPASHCGPVSPGSTNPKQPNKCARTRSHTDLVPAFNGYKEAFQSNLFKSTREHIGRSLNFSINDIDGYKQNDINGLATWSKREKETSPKNKPTYTAAPPVVNKRDHDTSTTTIDEFIKQLVRKELDGIIYKLPNEVDDREELVEKSANNVVNKLISNGLESEQPSLKTVKSFSQVNIKGNNKPLIQITIDKTSNDSVVKILDSCVSVSVAQNKGTEECADEGRNSLRRCQRFTSLQEARSTEDLYIDDELSSHLEETVAENMKLIPLHGSLHEILCEKRNECCLIKVQQESGCDNVYFMCNSPKNHSHDTVDSTIKQISPVLLKRSISLIEETFSIPKDTQINKSTGNIYEKRKRENSKRMEKVLKSSRSTPSLVKRDPVEIDTVKPFTNIDSSSDDDCLNDNDDFELMEKKIEDDFYCSSPNKSVLDKISEENDSDYDLLNKTNDNDLTFEFNRDESTNNDNSMSNA